MTQHEHDREEKLLKALGRQMRQQAPEPSSAPVGDHVEEDTLRALSLGQLAEARAEEVSSHLAGCDRCSRLLSLMAMESRPLAPAQRDAIVTMAMHEVRAGAPSEAPSEGWLERLQSLLRWRVVVPTLAVAVLALVVVRPLLIESPPALDVGGYSVEMSGGQQRFQGTPDASSPPSTLEARPHYSKSSKVKALLEPLLPTGPAVGEGSEVRPALSPDAASVVVLVKRADESLVVAFPGTLAQVKAGPGAIQVEGEAALLFDQAEGPVELWFVVAPPGETPSPSILNAPPDEAREKLEAGARAGRWWFGRHEAVYTLEFVPQ